MELEPVVAVRALTHPERGIVLVEVGAPRESDDHSEWVCPYRIGGPDNSVRFVGGDDAIQALQLVMAHIGADLAAMNAAVSGRMRWQEDEDLGFSGREWRDWKSGIFDATEARRAAEALQEFVVSDPELSGFRMAVVEFVENARRVENGDLTIGNLKNPATSAIPDRARAERIVQLVDALPAFDRTENKELLRAAAQLHGNAVEAVMHAVFADYSELVHDRRAKERR